MFKKIIKILGSLKLTIILIALLSIIVVWGTFYQVDHGIYAAQKRFFGSWFFIEFLYIPLPGIKTIITILAVNLLASGIRIFSFRIEKLGILLIHLGTAILIAGGGIAASRINESTITLAEGESTSVALRSHEWEISLFRKNEGKFTLLGRSIVSKLREGQNIKCNESDMTVKILELYSNCKAYGENPHFVESLQYQAPYKDGNNIPGVVVTVTSGSTDSTVIPKMVLYGGSSVPSIITLNDDTLIGVLQPVHVSLPLNIQLLKFTHEYHPGTGNARSYQSQVAVKNSEINRSAVISMNRPFRYKTVSFYQTGFSMDGDKVISTLTVVDNPVRFVPYLSGIIIIAGLLFHFSFALVAFIRKKQST
ncbi:MAG TPA: cytochrome c biogenesis protein ResB [Chitinispirillaceae bacterium]|nr:cytochrome c biogenesis protein ResB [Chitinispirillaceae bacterium]